MFKIDETQWNAIVTKALKSVTAENLEQAVKNVLRDDLRKHVEN